MWDVTDVIEERLSSSGVNRFFTDAEDLQGTDALVTRDHLRSPREALDSGGSLLTRVDYDPYGRAETLLGTLALNTGFTGITSDVNSGLLHLASPVHIQILAHGRQRIRSELVAAILTFTHMLQEIHFGTLILWVSRLSIEARLVSS